MVTIPAVWLPAPAGTSLFRRAPAPALELLVALPPVLAHGNLLVISCPCRGCLLTGISLGCSAAPLWGVASLHRVHRASHLFSTADEVLDGVCL